jgi:hypothetical protein
MKKCFLLIIGVCALVFQIYAQSNPSRIEKKSFPGIGEVRFEHSYGNITVTESDSKQVELEIRYFDGDEIKPVCETSTNGNVLVIKTVYPKNRNLWNNKQDKIKIDYVIAVPKNVAMNVHLRYGNINMGDFYGDFTCDIDYGNLNANTFFNSPVNIKGKYSNFKTDKVKVLNLSADYANVNINAADALNIQSKYTNYKIGKAETVKAECSYGTINIESVDEFDIELRYTPTTVENLGRKLNLECSYSNIKINNSSKQLESIKFSGSYSHLKLELDPDLSADLDADLKYGNLSVDDKYNVKYSLSETSYNRVTKKGTIGGKTPTAKIDIHNSYGNISIK